MRTRQEAFQPGRGRTSPSLPMLRHVAKHKWSQTCRQAGMVMESLSERGPSLRTMTSILHPHTI